MSGEDWKASLTENVLTERTIREWASRVDRLGKDTQNRREWAENFEAVLRDTCQELLSDVQQTQENLYSEIESLLKRAEELCKRLSIEMPDYGCEEMGLYAEEQMMIKHVAELQEQVEKRLEELQILTGREEIVCSSLGRPAKLIKDSPLPSRDQIDLYINRIKSLEEEQAKREGIFKKLKSEIMHVASELKYRPQLDFEKMILANEDDCDDDFIYNDFNMYMLQNFHETIIEKRDQVREEIASLRESIRSLWEMLGEDIQYCYGFLESHPGNSLEALSALKTEEKRCDKLKKANIQIFVQKLRVEMNDLWVKCRLTKEQRSSFIYYTDDTYTEDLLTLHDLEIKRLKSYFEENREIFELLEKREELWTKMLELEERSRAPDRFKNRGGQLLKEEKERNALFKRIPKIEEKLMQLTTEYELKNGKEFLYWGESVELVIKRCHDNYENDKKEKLSARKQKRDLSVLPANSTKRTPLKATLLMPNSITPARPSSSKRALATPMLSSTKRLKQANEVHKNGLKTAPSGINKATTRTKLRYSTEKKKRIEKLRRLSKVMKEQSSAKSTSNLAEYDDFENELSDRDACRSTIFNIPSTSKDIPSMSNNNNNNKKNNIPLIKVTPWTSLSKSPHTIRTFSKPPHTARTPSKSTRKFTTMKKLDMHF